MTSKGKKSNSETLVSLKCSAKKILLSQHENNNGKVIEYDDSTYGEEGVLPQTIIDDENLLLPNESGKKTYFFIDSRKVQNKLWPIMLDMNLKGILPNATNKLCWWDRNAFKTRPIGCPLKHHPKRLLVDDTVKNILGDIPTDRDFYETEGIFCSLSCCKAYILSQGNNLKYKDSIALLSMIVLSIYKKRINIPVAPSFKVLKEYGGHLGINEYRLSLGEIEYEENINSKRPLFISRSQYISEKKYKTK